MFTLIMVVALFIVLDIVALRWGIDSTDKITSCEFDRRRQWYNHADDQSAVY